MESKARFFFVPHMDPMDSSFTLLVGNLLLGIPKRLERQAEIRRVTAPVDYGTVFLGSTPHPVTVANEGLGWDSLLKM